MNEYLFSDFSPISTDEWKQLILKDLKGAPYSKVEWQTEEGFTLQPFYREEDRAELPRLQKRNPGWSLTETILNEEDLNQLDPKAVDAALIVSHSEGEKSYGYPLKGDPDFQKISQKLLGKPILFSLGTNTPSYLPHLQKIVSSHPSILADFDPYGTALYCGSMGYSEKELPWNLLTESKGITSVCVHSVYLRDSGASLGQELGYALAWGVSYLNRMLDVGIPLQDAAAQIWFWVGTGSDYFMEIAKHRALRLLWTEILNSYSPELGQTLPAIIFSRSSEFSFTAYDPYVNMLRGTTSAMASVLGTADFVSVLPFDVHYKEPSPLGKRIARNTQLLLRYESFLDKVEDPSSGSYYIDTLTVKLSEKAWSLLQDTETKGGFFALLQSGEIQKSVKSRASSKREELATRKELLLGTNQYPLTTERHPELGKSLLETQTNLQFQEPTEFERIEPIRLSYPLDVLRYKTDAFIARGRQAPKVFLLPIGDLTMRKARVTFSLNFIGSLGYEIQESKGFSNLEDGVQAAKDFGANIVVLCSSDEEYVTLLEPFTILMKQKLPEAWILVAGNPKDLVPVGEKLGVNAFIHMKSNLLQFMEKAQSKWIGDTNE